MVEGLPSKNGARGSPNWQSGRLLCPPIPNLEVLDGSTWKKILIFKWNFF